MKWHRTSNLSLSIFICNTLCIPFLSFYEFASKPRWPRFLLWWIRLLKRMNYQSLCLRRVVMSWKVRPPLRLRFPLVLRSSRSLESRKDTCITSKRFAFKNSRQQVHVIEWSVRRSGPRSILDFRFLFKLVRPMPYLLSVVIKQPQWDILDETIRRPNKRSPFPI